MGRIRAVLRKLAWGTLPQWISAVMAIVTGVVAIKAYNSPVFQNQILKEENSHLQIQQTALEESLWNYGCLMVETLVRAEFDGRYVSALMNAQPAVSARGGIKAIFDDSVANVLQHLDPSQRHKFKGQAAAFYRKIEEGGKNPQLLLLDSGLSEPKNFSGSNGNGVFDLVITTLFSDFVEHCQQK